MLTLRPVALDTAEARALIAALDEELTERYPEEGANHFRLDAQEVASGRGVFVVAECDGTLVGCGAVRLIAPDTAEIKRMYIVPNQRRRGHARAVLARLEDEARALGALRVVLETGVRQHDALPLYASAGYAPVPAWGEYADSPLSLCFGKVLGA